MTKKGFVPNKLRPWIEARKKYHLSHAQIQMARELGLNPKKFGGMANHRQEQWKVPLPDYIEHLYEKRFGNKLPDDIRPLEVRDAEKRTGKAQNKANKLSYKENIKSETITPVLDDMAKGDQALKSEFQSMFDMMYEQKQHYYPADNRFIVDYALEKNEEGFYLQVASTPFKAHNLAMAYISEPQ